MDLVFAYLDPGSGSIIIQAVIAGIVAVPVIFRNRISAFIRTVRGGGATEAKEHATEPSSPEPTPVDTTVR